MSKKKTTEQFIEEAKMVHGNKYDYSLVNYINNKTPICIICPKHGKFKQIPSDHLNGRGCNLCSKLVHDTESFIEQAKNSIENKYNIKPNFLDGLEADFLLEKEKIVIECQGTQHLLENHFFEPLSVVIKRDIKKLKQCNENGYKMIYVLNKENSECCLNEQFEHIYDNAIFIEDINKDNNILLKAINEKK